MSRTFKKEIVSGDIAKKSTDDTSFLVPSGALLRLNRFSGGWESSEKEMRIELLWGTSIIAVGYANGSNFQMDIDEDFTGDGIKSIIMRRVNQDKGDMHMSAWWEGTLNE